MTAADELGLVLEITSGVSLFDGSPFVVVGWGDHRAQLTPEATRALARDCMRAAEGAENDAALFTVLREQKVPDQVIVGVLARLRRERGE